MRLINLLPPVNLEGEVLHADVEVAVGATVGLTQAETAGVVQLRAAVTGSLRTR